MGKVQNEENGEKLQGTEKKCWEEENRCWVKFKDEVVGNFDFTDEVDSRKRINCPTKSPIRRSDRRKRIWGIKG